MTQIDEPDKLQELFENYHIVKYDNIDGYTRLGDSETDWYELYTSIKALIATQIQEAKLKELEDFRNSWHTMIRQEVHQDLNDRIAQLRSTK